VNDYATSTAITHDYDHVVVEQERIRSICAFPVVVDGTVRGVLYGATRETQPIGDVAMRQVGSAAAAISKDLESFVLPAASPGPDRDSTALTDRRAERALQELAHLTRSVTDPALRDRLARIHSDLGGSAWNGPDQEDVHGAGVALAPRELDALRLVELGASNTAIAGELGLTVPTVKAYLSSVMRKLDVRNRTSAVHVARSRGLL
jgi:DNA-binding NarL/FixJ family response regulator